MSKTSQASTCPHCSLDISSLISKVREEDAERVKDKLVDAGYAIETIRGYVDMGNKAEAERRLSMLSNSLLAFAQSIKGNTYE